MNVLTDGFSTTYTFSLNPSVRVKEIDVTPPPVQGGGKVDQTNMRNSAWRTASPKDLKTLGAAAAEVAYDTAAYDDIIAMVNVNQLITVNQPDGTHLNFWGWIDVFTPSKNTEGTRPTATMTMEPSNLNNSGVETAPFRS